MDLNKIIPNNENWSYSNGIFYFKKLQKIPICFINDDVFYILLENKIPKQVIELTKNLMKSDHKFYFTTPEAVNPSGVIDYKNEVLKSYFNSYSNKKFFIGFNKIGFDLIKNMINWSEENDAWHLVKPIYEDINKKIQKKNHDYYTRKDYYDYEFDIREEFRTLWREIQISKIL